RALTSIHRSSQANLPREPGPATAGVPFLHSTPVISGKAREMSSHAPVVPAASRPQHTDLDLVAWMRRHARLHLDIGTGDGKYALHVALRCSVTAVVGFDTSLDHL